MTYHFTILSPENEEFIRRVAIDHEATFLTLHQAIASSVGFEPNEMSSFFTSNDSWEKLEEITLLDMDDTDCMIMEDTVLCDILSKRKEKLIYTFDLLSDRCFFIELSKITTEMMAKDYMCTLSEGKAPIQIGEISGSTEAQINFGEISPNKGKKVAYYDDIPNIDEFKSLDDLDEIEDSFESDGFIEDEYY